MDGGTEAWVGAAALSAVAGMLGLGRMWLRNRRQASRERATIDLVKAGVPTGEVRRLLRDTGQTPEADDSTSE
ncbi:MAG: hypothetical protein AMXMBFR64_05200 [Myxococcales bacterium]